MFGSNNKKADKVIHCSKCHQPGHNKLSCGKNSPVSPVKPSDYDKTHNPGPKTGPAPRPSRVAAMTFDGDSVTLPTPYTDYYSAFTPKHTNNDPNRIPNKLKLGPEAFDKVRSMRRVSLASLSEGNNNYAGPKALGEKIASAVATVNVPRPPSVGDTMVSTASRRHGAYRVRIDSEPYYGAFGETVRVTVLDGPWEGEKMQERLADLHRED